MIETVQSDTFKTWLKGLKDRQARSRILVRIERLAAGNPGDSASVGDGIVELRFHFGPGYRVYCLPVGETLIVLLAGGDKSSQERDIALAKLVAEHWRI